MLDPRKVEAALDPDKIGQIGGMHGVPKRATILWEDMELIHAAARAWLAFRSVTDEEVEAAARLRAGQRMRWCEAHHDVVDYGRDDACRIALRINDEVACDIVKVALVRLAALQGAQP